MNEINEITGLLTLKAYVSATEVTIKYTFSHEGAGELRLTALDYSMPQCVQEQVKRLYHDSNMWLYPAPNDFIADHRSIKVLLENTELESWLEALRRMPETLELDISDPDFVRRMAEYVVTRKDIWGDEEIY